MKKILKLIVFLFVINISIYLIVVFFSQNKTIETELEQIRKSLIYLDCENQKVQKQYRIIIQDLEINEKGWNYED